MTRAFFYFRSSNRVATIKIILIFFFSKIWTFKGTPSISKMILINNLIKGLNLLSKMNVTLTTVNIDVKGVLTILFWKKFSNTYSKPVWISSAVWSKFFLFHFWGADAIFPWKTIFTNTWDRFWGANFIFATFDDVTSRFAKTRFPGPTRSAFTVILKIVANFIFTTLNYITSRFAFSCLTRLRCIH